MTTPDLWTTAMAVSVKAVPDDDFEGQFVDYLVPAPAIDALRAALVDIAPDGDRPPLDPATLAHDAAYMAGLVRGRELERAALAADTAPSPDIAADVREPLCTCDPGALSWVRCPRCGGLGHRPTSRP